MWDWYNRPGGRASLSARRVALILVISGLLVGAIFMLLYILLAPHIFTRLPVSVEWASTQQAAPEHSGAHSPAIGG